MKTPTDRTRLIAGATRRGQGRRPVNPPIERASTMLSDRVGVMSTRPGTFIDFVVTGWERDRDSRVVSTPHFGDITARLWEKLRVEALKIMSAGKS